MVVAAGRAVPAAACPAAGEGFCDVIVVVEAAGGLGGESKEPDEPATGAGQAGPRWSGTNVASTNTPSAATQKLVTNTAS
ncbi:hypothetical protein ACPPVO_40090 [Dactylosporangium sp. McL0621]|uniref:hypothetical protein n=1 Tax=Dactylosporangium sp. McL0621 TaxID=3415678 RepID=UPI003CEFF861